MSKVTLKPFKKLLKRRDMLDRARANKGKFAKDVEGPEGLFRIDVQDAEAYGNRVVWSVDKILSDGPDLSGSQLMGVYKTRGDAHEAALKFAHGTMPETPAPPRVDRRGLVAHSRKL
jgi:hypothetical protein